MVERRIIRIPLDAKAERTADIATEADRVQIAMSCDVDGCTEPLWIEPLWHDRRYLVRHGEGEAQKEFSDVSLLVTNGYQGWVREVHAYEAGRTMNDV